MIFTILIFFNNELKIYSLSIFWYIFIYYSYLLSMRTESLFTYDLTTSWYNLNQYEYRI